MLFNQDIGFQERDTYFVEVILPLSLGINYTYRVPFELNSQIAIGKRVVVQFGKHKIYTALIKAISQQAPDIYQAKYIIDVVDQAPILNEIQFQFWDWLKQYYLCNEGDIMSAALPGGLKLASETFIILKDEQVETQEALNEKESLIYEVLKKQIRLQIDEVSAILGQKTIYPTINSLLAKELIVVEEEMHDKFKPLLKSFVQLNPIYQQESLMKELFEQLERAPKQLAALLAYLKLKPRHADILKSAILDESGCGHGAFKALEDKGVFTITKRAVSRLADSEAAFEVNFKLSTAQQNAFNEVKEHWVSKAVVLLFGVTASGKTQIYLKLIEEVLATGKQVLFLLPEIALTTQIVERIKLYFGDKIGVYHSKFNPHERVEIWNKVLNGDYQIVLGARSAVFLPFKNLGLVIIDEEHETSYKQHDPAPRYHARDAAIYLAHLFSAKVLLGSASPAIESYYNAQQGKYGLVNLTERFGQVPLPDFKLVNLAEATKRKQMTAYFSQALIEEMQAVLDAGDQVILFQNRRGYATILLCATCGFAPKCVNCDVSLTYHKSSGKLHCHYCGYQDLSLVSCPACGSVHIEQKGFGTERLEEELSLIFPHIKISRLDLDTARSKNGMQHIIEDFQAKKSQILIGTQMVAKGLDFDHVQLIGVVNADILLNYPDFRAFERTYQLLAQVAGRAGRRDKQGFALVQAYNDQHRILQQVKNHDYLGMYQTELLEREKFNYPPYSRLIVLTLKHKDYKVLNQASHYLAKELRSVLANRVLGPEQPLVSRVRNYYLMQIQLKIERKVSVGGVKLKIQEFIHQLNTIKEFKSVWVQIDVDPF